jgi:hypothetical protein
MRRVVQHFAGHVIGAIRGRFLKSLGGYLAELFDGLVLGFLRRCLRVGLFSKPIIRYFPDLVDWGCASNQYGSVSVTGCLSRQEPWCNPEPRACQEWSVPAWSPTDRPR